MRKIFGVLIILVSLALGVGAAVGVQYLRVNQISNAANNGYGYGAMMGGGYGQGNGNFGGRGSMMGNGRGQGNGDFNGRGSMMGGGYGQGNGNFGGRGSMMGGGYGQGNGNFGGRGSMMGNGYGFEDRNNSQSSGERITIDKAIENVQKALSSYENSGNLKAVEIMEFDRNFYVPVKEVDNNQGAFELLVDPWSGEVYFEHGPNQMWNLKYGHMASGSTAMTENTVTFERAKELAQQYLDKQIAGAKVEGDGMTFYGYYTFDYEKDGKIAGMLSVHGQSGQVWLHTWHGSFIGEQTIQ